ncbi:ankyrin [Aaosphaeria arxii CBS 175.79]|uniref:Ankyrin n=1 Tax=Aaosphaeria arxii CBS 175.79 TaxID=1450172 RepID=A0A6A5X8P7_9PLEO|nr:ankyrin [Aaosphaeria arxii CBS 175.79]KAF2009266.1 ankyrin [Aaosphaeria arxii CBS 175.79]
MTSNGDASLNPSDQATVAAGAPTHRAASPATQNTAPPASLRDGQPSPRPSRNGENTQDDAQNESEAETVVLDDAKDSTSKEKKVIKMERDDDDDDDNAAKLRSIKESSRTRTRTRSPIANGRRHSVSDAKELKEVKLNGARRGSDPDGKSPPPTSPGNRTHSRHAKDASPDDSVKSPVLPTTSPTQHATRGRSSSITESRKRKLRDESHTKSLEPLRQKAKTEGLKELRTQPNSPATPGVGRPHKRSQSTQSAVQGVPGRKRKEVTALTLPPERRNYSDSSSEHSSSPHPAHTPHLLHNRVKRSSHRALTSPARAMTHKRNVDKFGATRLARESEKGDLDQVIAAYNAASEELDQEDFAGIAPLQKAALHGWADVVEFLIKKGCRTDCESNDRDTPLIDAVENGHLDVVKLLLHKGHVNPHHQNKKGQRAIDVLDPDEDDATEIEAELRAAMRRQTDTAKKEEDTTPGFAQQKSASRLLYNEYNLETLIEKSGDGDMAAVGELLNSNIRPNIACGVAASRGGYDEVLSILLASGLKPDPDPSKHTDTPMLVAIGRGHMKVIQLLLNQDLFNPTRRNRDGKTYYEISEERRGPKWELERDLLKDAYDTYSKTHKSPKRVKKEAPNAAAVRAKKRSSPSRREPSSSPRPEAKRALTNKSSAGLQKSRRLMSGKEIASRDVKRRRRVVSDESSDEDSDADVRPPKKAHAKPRSYSEGEENKQIKRAIKESLDSHTAPKRAARAGSADSEDGAHPPQKRGPKIRTKVTNSKPTPTPEVESPDERKPVKNKIKSRILEEKIKKRRASDVSIDETKVKRTPTASSKSTPAPPEKAATPDIVRERRLEQEKQAAAAAEAEAEAEAKRKAAEAESKKREEEEQAARKAARKAAEEEEARRKAEAEAAAEAEAKRLAEKAKAEAEAEAARKREEEKEKQRQEAEEEAKRQEMLAARRDRISKLPRALRRACELGSNRPLHFSGEELGISAVFLPLFYATSKDVKPHEHQNAVSKSYVMSFQAVGILGLPELDLAHLDAPYSEWERIPVTRDQRELLLRQYDVALLAQDYRFPMAGPDFDFAQIQDRVKEARQQFLDLEGLYWIEDSVLPPEVDKVDILRPLLADVKDPQRRRQIHLCELVNESAPEKKRKPRKSFMDAVLGQSSTNGIADSTKINGGG